MAFIYQRKVRYVARYGKYKLFNFVTDIETIRCEIGDYDLKRNLNTDRPSDDEVSIF